MIMPRHIVSPLIAGLVDPAVADLCYSELQEIHEKFAQFFFRSGYLRLIILNLSSCPHSCNLEMNLFCLISGLVEGVRQMFMLHRVLPGFRPRDVSSYDNVAKAADRLYRLFRSNAKARNDFLQKIVDQIVRSIDMPPKSPATQCEYFQSRQQSNLKYNHQIIWLVIFWFQAINRGHRALYLISILPRHLHFSASVRKRRALVHWQPDQSGYWRSRWPVGVATAGILCLAVHINQRCLASTNRRILSQSRCCFHTTASEKLRQGTGPLCVLCLCMLIACYFDLSAECLRPDRRQDRGVAVEPHGQGDVLAAAAPSQPGPGWAAPGAG